MKPKQVQITYHTLVKKMYKTSPDYDENNQFHPFFEAPEIFSSILKLSKKKRFFNLQNDKFCFVSNAKVEELVNDVIMIQGNFISARNKFRPNLINRKTGEERPNPRALSEGDIERTHFAVKVDVSKDEVYLFLQKNHQGLTKLNFTNYLNAYSKKYLSLNKLKKDYVIQDLIIGRDDFLPALKALKRTRLAELWVKKEILGSPALNFSNRTASVKSDIKITIPSITRESITSVAIDAFNLMNSSNGPESPIDQIRIYGKDIDGNETILDTGFMGKVDHVNVDLNPETGELIGTDLANAIRHFAHTF